MRAIEVENWARQVIEQVKNHRNSEEDRVECKSTWIEPKDAAKNIAALANRSRGEPILWLVGVDEGNENLPGADKIELANWWPQVQKCFDEVSPDLVNNINLIVDSVTVVALVFDTNLAPYVIKIDGGQVTHAVYWREGTRTRSAKRSEMLRTLIPQLGLPVPEVLAGTLKASIIDGGVRPTSGDTTTLVAVVFELTLAVYLHVEGKRDYPLAFPYHQLKAAFQVEAKEFNGEFDFIRFEGLAASPFGFSGTSQATRLLVTPDSSQLLVEGPGLTVLKGSYRTSIPVVPIHEPVEIRVEARPSLESKSMIITQKLEYTQFSGNSTADYVSYWAYGNWQRFAI